MFHGNKLSAVVAIVEHYSFFVVDTQCALCVLLKMRQKAKNTIALIISLIFLDNVLKQNAFSRNQSYLCH